MLAPAPPAPPEPAPPAPPKMASCTTQPQSASAAAQVYAPSASVCGEPESGVRGSGVGVTDGDCEIEPEVDTVPEPDGVIDTVADTLGVREYVGVGDVLAVAPELGVCVPDGVGLGVGCTTPWTKKGVPKDTPGTPPVFTHPTPLLAVVAKAAKVRSPKLVTVLGTFSD